MTLSIHEKIGQMLMIGFDGTTLPEETANFIQKNNIGFVVLFARNIESIAQITELTNHIHRLCKIPPFIFTDQEGGTVVQFGEMAATAISPMGLAATGISENARQAGQLIAKDLGACGFDGILAPVLDVNIEPNNPIIGIRSFSDKPEIVSQMASAFIAGVHQEGLAVCGKHFPNHGSTSEDSHLTIPRSHISKKKYFSQLFPPFSQMIRQQIDSLMTAHIILDQLDLEMGTFSPYFIQELLRSEHKYQGVVFTDCLEMKAIGNYFDPLTVVSRSVSAGIDVLVASRSLPLQREYFDNLADQVNRGEISSERIDLSYQRILKLKKKFNPQLQPKCRNSATTPQIVRQSKAEEQKIADQSITLLKDESNNIPIDTKKNILIIEWDKVKATIPLSHAEHRSMLAPLAQKYLQNYQIVLVGLDESIPKEIIENIHSFHSILAVFYTRNPETARKQSIILKKILKTRKDIILVSLGNPYDSIGIPEIQTNLLTYGFRQIQLEALFKVLTGSIPPQGKVPVNIPRNYPTA